MGRLAAQALNVRFVEHACRSRSEGRCVLLADDFLIGPRLGASSSRACGHKGQAESASSSFSDNVLAPEVRIIAIVIPAHALRRLQCADTPTAQSRGRFNATNGLVAVCRHCVHSVLCLGQNCLTRDVACSARRASAVRVLPICKGALGHAALSRSAASQMPVSAIWRAKSAKSRGGRPSARCTPSPR